jgi:transcriptional regulator with XRE-family HTH domain
MNEQKKQSDRFASEFLKRRRIDFGLTQKELGAAIDITALQIKKYEEGISSIPISRLYALAKILNTPLKYFFDVSDNKADASYSLQEFQSSSLSYNLAENAEEYNAPFYYQKLSRAMEREILSLVRAFTKVQNPRTRKIIIELVKSIGGQH